MTGPEYLGTHYDSEFDEMHLAAVGMACDQDRARCATGEKSFLRLAVPHEFCRPGQSCETRYTLTQVDEIEPGTRSRVAIYAPLPRA